MPTEHPNNTTADRAAGPPTDVPAAADWVVGVLATLIGAGMTLGGGIAYLVLDRGELQSEVAGVGGSLSQFGLTERELVSATLPAIESLFLGIITSGLLLLVGGVVFVLLRRRTRRRATNPGTVGAHAAYGAATTALVAFVPFSSVVGGAVAGYLEPAGRSGTRTGALSGLLGVAPAAVILGAGALGVVAGANAVGELGAGLLIGGFGGLLAVTTLVAFGAGLGAVGGYVASRLA